MMKIFIAVSKDMVADCYDFACKMEDAHNYVLIQKRKPYQIFIDDFRGKLAEVAIKRYLEKKAIL